MATDPKPAIDLVDYWKTRNFKTSSRLHLQHYLFQDTIGFLLHPNITESWKPSGMDKKVVKVADLGCGNARWLCDLARETPLDVQLQLHGYDVNPVNFPATWYIPENVKLQKLDVLEEIPAELVGSFDVVHLRAFASIVTKGEPGPLVKNAVKLLKPGGWLQWEESTPDQLVAEAVDENVSKTTCDMIIQIVEQGAKQQHLDYSWIHKLDSHFQKCQLEHCELNCINKRPDTLKAWTENYLLVWEDLTQMLPTKENAPNAPITREMWQGLFLKAVEEADSGVAIHHRQLVVAIGQKAA